MSTADGKEAVRSKGEKNMKENRRNRFSSALMPKSSGHTHKSEKVSYGIVESYSSSDDEIEYSDLSEDDDRSSSKKKGALRRFVPGKPPRSEHDKVDKGLFLGVNLSKLAAPLKLSNFDQREPELITKAAVSDIEKLAQKSGKNTEHERFRVMPNYAYPRVKFNREELRKEVNKQSSYFHDLRGSADDSVLLGSFYLEILQCFGIPRSEELLKETSAFCLAVCGSCAFRTDVMPPVANPMWLSKMRRACIFPLYEGFANIYVGCFAHHQSFKDLFLGRVVLDVAKLRQGSTYDVTLPLRKSGVVYTTEKRGAIRVRFHLDWKNERKALLSYLPKRMPSFKPLEKVTVRCCDNKAFQNVARVVHGHDMPMKFSMKLVKSTIREFDFVQIHILRYIRKREIRNLMRWEFPVISCYVFFAWMHAVLYATIRYVPGHFVTFVLLHICKNYALYVLEGNYDKGFTSPTWEEMLAALFFGNENRRWVQPLEMERKDPSNVHSAMQFFDDQAMPEEVPLQAIANSFRSGVKRKDRKTLFGNVLITFVGTDAVDFLVENAFAESRLEAVAIGLRLEKECRLFEHVNRRFPFKDSDLDYTFLHYDTSEYVFKTHRPWFKHWLRLTGFGGKKLSNSEAHLEMPFADGNDHPKFTVKDSLVIRSKESRSFLRKEHEAGDEEDIDDFGITKYRKNIELSNQVFSGISANPKAALPRQKSPPKMSRDKSTLSVDLEVEHYRNSENENLSLDTSDSDDENPMIFEKKLQKPPVQDITIEKKDDKKVADVMVEVRHELHDKLGNLFNIRAYKLSLDGAHHGEQESRSSGRSLRSRAKSKRSYSPTRLSKEKSKRSFSPTRKALKSLKSMKSTKSVRSNKSMKKSSGTKNLDVNNLAALTARKDEYDRLLQVSKYSHSNVIISKIASILSPLVDIAQMVLSMFRLSFNVMTWRDPSLTFWVVVLGVVLVAFLHLFPWRLFLGAVGLGFVGPHNWVIRILKERKEGKEEFDYDREIRKKRKERSNQEHGNAPFFSSYAPDNRLVREDQFDTSRYMEVAVPVTPLYFRRFYDWPPEPEYARVARCLPPSNDPVAEQLLEDDDFELYDGDCEYDDDSTVLSKGTWGSRAMGIAKRVKPTLRNRKRLPDVDEMTSTIT